jgi:hypothetical protein
LDCLWQGIPESDVGDKVFNVLPIVMRDGPSTFEGDREILMREAPFFDVFRQAYSPQRPVVNATLAGVLKYAQNVHSSAWTLELLQGESSFEPIGLTLI